MGRSYNKHNTCCYLHHYYSHEQ